MSKTKIIALIVIFVVFMLPALIILYAFMLFGANFSRGAQQVAFILFVVGFWADFFAAATMD